MESFRFCLIIWALKLICRRRRRCCDNNWWNAQLDNKFIHFFSVHFLLISLIIKPRENDISAIIIQNFAKLSSTIRMIYREWNYISFRFQSFVRKPNNVNSFLFAEFVFDQEIPWRNENKTVISWEKLR